MNREMYKKERQISDEAARELFAKGNHGTLAVNGDDGYPYAVPVNYVYYGGSIYIHSAKYGYKIDAVQRDDKVCFSAILDSEIQQDKFTAAFRSIVAFGRISFVEDEAEKKRILEEFIYKMTPDFIEGGMKFVKGAIGKTALLKIEVEEIKGKQSLAETFDVK